MGGRGGTQFVNAVTYEKKRYFIFTVLIYILEYINIDVNRKVQLDTTICRHLFTAKSLYMFRESQHPSPGALKTVTATSGIGHNTGTATSFQRGRLSRPRWKEVAVPVL